MGRPQKKSGATKSSQSRTSDSKLTRLNKFLASCGVCSRRKADEHIEEGDVKVNGKTVREHGVKVHPQQDVIKFKNKIVKPQSDFVYIILFKPRNFITTLSDPHGRPTVIDLIPKKYSKMHLFPIGRLDWSSEGLLLLTNDGEYAQNVLHPKKEITKTYEVKIEGDFNPKDIDKLKNGISIPGGKAKATDAKTFKKSKVGTHTWLRLSVTEGRNRLIRRMMEKLGYSVMRLRRVAIGDLKIGQLKAGEWAFLNESQKDLALKS